MASTWILFLLIPIALMTLNGWRLQLSVPIIYRNSRRTPGDISEELAQDALDWEQGFARHEEFRSWSPVIALMRELRDLASAPSLDVVRIRQIRVEAASMRGSRFGITPHLTVIGCAKELERIARKQAKLESP
jgi:hypothetical protein